MEKSPSEEGRETDSVSDDDSQNGKKPSLKSGR